MRYFLVGNPKTGDRSENHLAYIFLYKFHVITFF